MRLRTPKRSGSLRPLAVLNSLRESPVAWTLKPTCKGEANTGSARSWGRASGQRDSTGKGLGGGRTESGKGAEVRITSRVGDKTREEHRGQTTRNFPFYSKSKGSHWRIWAIEMSTDV